MLNVEGKSSPSLESKSPNYEEKKPKWEPKTSKKKRKQFRRLKRDDLVTICVEVTEESEIKKEEERTRFDAPVLATASGPRLSRRMSLVFSSQKPDSPEDVPTPTRSGPKPTEQELTSESRGLRSPRKGTKYKKKFTPSPSKKGPRFQKFKEAKSPEKQSDSPKRWKPQSRGPRFQKIKTKDASTSTSTSKLPLLERVAGGANGIFTRRQDFSSFNSLPKIKLNSYQIKTEDEGNHGNDDTRCFILSTLASHGRSKVQCVLCEEYLLVFDRYPLIDGTFFLSPRQHAKFCVEVKVEGRLQFLTCVCMGCLEGVTGKAVSCRFCKTKWDGSSLVLGTMYSYDIFAAMPCCVERIKCNSCYKPVLHPAQRLNFFSDYSHMVPCPHCRTLDTHFVKPLGYCFIQRVVRSLSQWP